MHLSLISIFQLMVIQLMKLTILNFLGVIIDSKLNWKDHISYITGKLLEEFVLLQRLQRCLIKKH